MVYYQARNLEGGGEVMSGKCNHFKRPDRPIQVFTGDGAVISVEEAEQRAKDGLQVLLNILKLHGTPVFIGDTLAGWMDGDFQGELENRSKLCPDLPSIETWDGIPFEVKRWWAKIEGQGLHSIWCLCFDKSNEASVKDNYYFKPFDPAKHGEPISCNGWFWRFK